MLPTQIHPGNMRACDCSAIAQSAATLESNFPAGRISNGNYLMRAAVLGIRVMDGNGLRDLGISPPT